MSAHQRYSAGQVDTMIELRRRGLSVKEIAMRYGRTASALRTLFRRQKVLKTVWKYPPKPKAIHHPVMRAVVPEAVLEDRERRLLEYRTPQEELMGDPAPCQSALGRRLMPIE